MLLLQIKHCVKCTVLLYFEIQAKKIITQSDGFTIKTVAICSRKLHSHLTEKKELEISKFKEKYNIILFSPSLLLLLLLLSLSLSYSLPISEWRCFWGYLYKKSNVVCWLGWAEHTHMHLHTMAPKWAIYQKSCSEKIRLHVNSKDKVVLYCWLGEKN